MTLDYPAIGKRIKIARIKAGLSQERLAEKADVSTGHMSNIETGSANVSLKTLVSIANTLHVTLDELLADSVISTTSVIRSDIEEILSDCDEYEIRTIASIMEAAKDAIRRERRLREETSQE